MKVEKKVEASHAESLIVAVLTKKGVTVSSPNNVESLSMRGYGVKENGKLVLAPYETLFLVEKGLVKVRKGKKGSVVGFQELLQHFQTVDENTWVKYLIYRDLRTRGYVAREGFGFGVDFRVYERGEYGQENAKYLIFGIQEGKPVSVEELAQALQHVQRLKKKLVLAVINRRGEVVYYSLSQLTLKK